MVTSGRQDLKDIGCYRTDKEPMQVVSGAVYAPKCISRPAGIGCAG